MQEVRDGLNFVINFVFVLESGDIGYTPGGVFPKRKHNVPHGVYLKRGDQIENQWEGLITV